MVSQIPEDLAPAVKEWLGYDYDPQTREAVMWLVENDPAGLRESFGQRLTFGTGGMRGLMGAGPGKLNIYTVAAAAQAVASYIGSIYTDGQELRAVIAYDSRNNSERFASVCADTLAANGVRTYLFDGVRPVPELSYTVRTLRCHVGIAITASHNPKEYNGFKLYWANGAQVVAPHDAGVLAAMAGITKFEHVKRGGDRNLIISIGADVDEAYLNQLVEKDLTPALRPQRSGLKIVYTPLHGTGARLTPLLLKRLGFSQVAVVSKQNIPDGDFPTTPSPNPEDPNAMALAVEQAQGTGATLVLGTDPDADRMGAFAADRHGKLVRLDGEQIGLLIANYLLQIRKRSKRPSKKDYMVRTIVTSPLLDRLAAHYGVTTYTVLPGFKYIASLIDTIGTKGHFMLGVEESHGYLAGCELRDKDGIQACGLFAQLTAWAASRGCTPIDDLESIYHEIGFSHKAQRSLMLEGSEGKETMAEIMQTLRTDPLVEIAGEKVVKVVDFLSVPIANAPDKTSTLIIKKPANALQFITESESVVTVRPSGTEPKIKFYASASMPFESIETTLPIAERRTNALLESLVIL